MLLLRSAARAKEAKGKSGAKDTAAAVDHAKDEAKQRKAEAKQVHPAAFCCHHLLSCPAPGSVILMQTRKAADQERRKSRQRKRSSKPAEPADSGATGGSLPGDTDSSSGTTVSALTGQGSWLWCMRAQALPGSATASQWLASRAATE